MSTIFIKNSNVNLYCPNQLPVRQPPVNIFTHQQFSRSDRWNPFTKSALTSN
ncbi:hypothetical protein SLEP1_g34026 [Rubroshorea leprosula]|uniref:Ribosomal protein L36 n=1 Tax=Rubroshorea leprosula TaxID=152421 RepID=A0AAV5KII7_9ROSI|nr:hypothetical protein SLEP1_g34026 [Rubroshorea leprosula]